MKSLNSTEQKLAVEVKKNIEVAEIIRSIQASPSSTQEEKAFFLNRCEIIYVKKGKLLLKQGQIAHSCYYVYKGIIREFINTGCEERTVDFYSDGSSLSDDNSKLNQIPSALNWECCTDCIISVFPYEVEKEMYEKFPRLETLCRMEVERKFAGYKQSVTSYLTITPEERYDNLLKSRPEIFEHVPLYQIASYIGVKPESLSRIRNRIYSKVSRSR